MVKYKKINLLKEKAKLKNQKKNKKMMNYKLVILLKMLFCKENLKKKGKPKKMNKHQNEVYNINLKSLILIIKIIILV